MLDQNSDVTKNNTKMNNTKIIQLLIWDQNSDLSVFAFKDVGHLPLVEWLKTQL